MARTPKSARWRVWAYPSWVRMEAIVVQVRAREDTSEGVRWPESAIAWISSGGRLVRNDMRAVSTVNVEREECVERNLWKNQTGNGNG